MSATNHAKPINFTTYIIILCQAEELADLGSTLGSKALGMGDVGQASDVVVTLLDDNEGENREVHTDDAATDGLALALTGAAGAVAAVSLGEEKLNTGGVHNTLLHRETLLVVSSGDLEDVAGEFGADAVTRDLLAHALVHEDAEAALIFNVDELLGAVGRVAVERGPNSSACRSFEYIFSSPCPSCTLHTIQCHHCAPTKTSRLLRRVVLEDGIKEIRANKGSKLTPIGPWVSSILRIHLYKFHTTGSSRTYDIQLHDCGDLSVLAGRSSRCAVVGGRRVSGRRSMLSLFRDAGFPRGSCFTVRRCVSSVDCEGTTLAWRPKTTTTMSPHNPTTCLYRLSSTGDRINHPIWTNCALLGINCRASLSCDSESTRGGHMGMIQVLIRSPFLLRCKAPAFDNPLY